MLTQHKDIETTDDCFDLTLKYYNSFSVLQEQIVSYYEGKGIKVTPDDVILYEIMYNKANQGFMVLNRYDGSGKDETLEKLKICHQGRFIVVLKNTGILVNWS
jgi:hypothetical protein